MTTPTTENEKTPYDRDHPPHHPIDVDKIKQGHVMLISQYVSVTSKAEVFGGNSVDLLDLDTGTRWTRSGREIVQRMSSADQFEEEVKLPRTEVVARLLAAGDKPLTVCWMKEKGTKERVLRGRFVSADERDIGYSYAEDLDLPVPTKPAESRLRQVDHREVLWLIVDGVKYVVKKR